MSKVEAEIVDDDTISGAVIEAIAEAEGTDVIELSPPLYEVIEPEALEHLFDGHSTLGKVVFTYNGCEVSVFDDGYVSVEKHGE